MKRIIAIVVLLLLVTESLSAQQSLQFEVKLNAEEITSPKTGRVMVFLSKQNRSPMNGPNWFSPEPFYGIDVKELVPGASVVIDDTATGFPGKVSELEPGEYFVQAILDQDFYFANHTNGPGNVFSRPKKIKIGPDRPAAFDVELTEVIGEPSYDETEWFKIVSLDSQILSKFHNREVIERAAVVLPPSYHKEPNRRFPVYYIITGFGGTLRHMSMRWGKGQPEPNEGDEEFIRVYLTGQCKWGHHVYANSATNGPRGDSFVHEMIPLIEKNFRTIAKPEGRYLGGHSSGGWSSLWLQVTYPDMFNGVWSTAPDPVDFRDWQGTNIYDEGGASVFFDSEGNKRPLARRGKTPMVWYPDFCKMDDVMARGGQLRSFEAVFSPRGEDGLPVKCWDRKTGKVNPEVVNYWKQYDISLKLEKNWAELSPKLAGKIHVYMGDLDTFYLEGATKLLGERLKKLGSDAVVEIFPGKDHGSLMTKELRQRILREMSAKFREVNAND